MWSFLFTNKYTLLKRASGSVGESVNFSIVQGVTGSSPDMPVNFYQYNYLPCNVRVRSLIYSISFTHKGIKYGSGMCGKKLIINPPLTYDNFEAPNYPGSTLGLMKTCFTCNSRLWTEYTYLRHVSKIFFAPFRFDREIKLRFVTHSKVSFQNMEKPRK